MIRTGVHGPPEPFIGQEEARRIVAGICALEPPVENEDGSKISEEFKAGFREATAIAAQIVAMCGGLT